jgi:hypothetical protein
MALSKEERYRELARLVGMESMEKLGIRPPQAAPRPPYRGFPPTPPKGIARD